MRKQKNKIQIDDKYRVCLGNFLSEEERKQFSGFKISRQTDGKIILDPLIEVPASEHWIYKNPDALASLMRGIEDIKANRIEDLDIDLSQFLDKDDEL